MSSSARAAQPLTTLQYQILGTQLRVSPAAVSVPKGVPGSILVQLTAGDGSTNNVDASLVNGAYIEAILRGPAFPARRLVGRPGDALMLPSISLVGDYQLDGIRLVDTVTGATRLEGSPASVPVHVFDQVLVSTVTSRPLTMQEIVDKGIVIDANNFRAVEFEAAFVLDGQTFKVRLPVVAPDFKQSTELIPNSELYERLVQAQLVNEQLAQRLTDSGDLPRELQRPGLNIQIRGVNFQKSEGEVRGLELAIPPLPALMVIPGNIGYLNQFFSVQIFTENASPLNSGLSVFDVTASLKLPPGPDGIASTNYTSPGDDPLRFARVGTQAEIHDTLPIFGPAPEKATRLYPGRSGSAEFLVEGLQEGLHLLNLDLNASLDGLAAGTVRITGKAAGSVLVRNPKFSMAFSHPKTVRSGEPYTAYVTVLNTGGVEAKLASVSLRGASISGGVLESPERVELGNIGPGQSATASFRVLAQRTGAVKFSNLTLGDSSLQGQFTLTMGIDERGVVLSPDTIAMPDFVTCLPTAVIEAANRVLGQALSAATAPLLPAGVKPVSRATITRRVLELAEAGQRLKYNDPTNRVLVDLMLDWQGGRVADDLKRQEIRVGSEDLQTAASAPVVDDGFDQILRTTEAGRQFCAAIQETAEAVDGLDSTARLVGFAPEIAGRGEAWLLSSSSEVGLMTEVTGATGMATSERSDLAETLVYPGFRGTWAVVHAATAVLRWTATTNVASAEVSVVTLGTNGTGRRWRWTVRDIAAGSCFRFDPASPERGLSREVDCNGAVAAVQVATAEPIVELPPSVLTVIQDTDVVVSRPNPSCTPGPARNYGQALGILFSKPMVQAQASLPTAYRLDNGNFANRVQMQPGGRIALISMREGVSAIRSRQLTVSGVSDERGNRVIAAPQAVSTDFRDGVAVRGRVMRADGTPAGGVPVTVTMYDLFRGPATCDPIITRTSQKYTDASGAFDFDFVLAGVNFTIAAVDTGGLTVEGVQTIFDSSVGDRFAREKLAALAAATNAFSTLGVANLTQATRLIEGMDRAVWSDAIEYQGGRMGQEIVVGLRFRGRAVVSGTVVEADGVTPVRDAAVNLFPDAESRELVRGMFSDKDGRFEFNGVPLGRFTINVQTSQRHFRTVAGNLTQVGATNDYTIALTPPAALEIVRSSLSGRVVEPDGVTGHGQARVFVTVDNAASSGLVAAPTADQDGYWRVDNIPVGTASVQAYSRDGRRGGTGRGSVATNAVGFVVTVLNGTGDVVGRVVTSTGAGVSNALVAGGITLVRTDADGFFRLTDVPQGFTKISAGWEAQDAPGGFPRLASASITVLPEVDNSVIIRFPARGQIVGRVVDANGEPVTGKNVAVPLDNGFAWVPLDGQGGFQFPNMLVRDYFVSAPAPPVDGDVEKILDSAAGGSSDQILAALRNAAVAAGQVALRRLGEVPAVNPGSFGWVKTRVNFDGDTAFVTIRYRPEGTVSGKVINGHGVPIGAAVRLTGPGLDGIGQPATVILGTASSDPALGTFHFPRLPQGDWALQAASPFYPRVLVTNGFTTFEQLGLSNVVMRFPGEDDFNGRLAGQVLLPDGSPAGADVRVKINFGTNYEIRTDATGVFDTQFKIPAGSYSVEATDSDGLRGMSSAVVRAGLTNTTTVQLIGKGALQLFVRNADSSPATNATVSARLVAFPYDVFNNVPGVGGQYMLRNIFAGPYALTVRSVTGATVLMGQIGINVTMGTTNSAIITLGPTATIRGIFRRRSDGAPVGSGAMVKIGSSAVTTTADDGTFQVSGLALGSYQIVARDPVSGRAALTSASLTFNGQIADVSLTELFQGELLGTVFQTSESQPIPGASVTLNQDQNLVPAITITTGPDGGFTFPAAIPGRYTLNARKFYPPNESYSSQVAGAVPDNTARLTVDITLPARRVPGRVTVQLYEPDGVTPATNATVNGLSVDERGQIVVGNLPMGLQIFQARSRRTGQSSSVGEARVTLTPLSANLSTNITLSGVGRVHGFVLASDGTTPAAGALVEAVGLRPNLGVNRRFRGFANGSGEFVVDDLPLAPVTLSAALGALAASGSTVISNSGQTAEVVLRLGPSGSVLGRLLRADGITIVTSSPVTLSFAAPSGLDGTATALTDAAGEFQLASIPVGAVDLTAVVPEISGLAKVHTRITTNGQVLNLGDILLRETWPEVVAVTPVPGSQSMSTTTQVHIAFSEPIATNSIRTNGIYLRGPSNFVPCDLTWDAPTNIGGGTLQVHLKPKASLQSLAEYRVYVLAGTLTDGFGRTVGQGPLSLVDRPLLAPFISTFVTRDDVPPRIVSVAPTNHAVQVDPAAAVRLSFDEPISDQNLSVSLSGPAGPIPGTVSLTFNGTVLSFTPLQPLLVNSTYTFRMSGVRDLVGNLLNGQPLTIDFATLDTLGPTISTLQIANGQKPVAGAPVVLEALLATNEPGAVVRFTANFITVGTVTRPPFRLPVTLPFAGPITYRAIATDGYGNDGPVQDLTPSLQPNDPPVVVLARATPATNVLASGQVFTVVAAATDDVSVTNINLLFTGAFNYVTNVSGSASNLMQFFLPPTVVAGPLLVEARATDRLGLSSATASLAYTVKDVTAPAVAILAPTNNSLLNPAIPLAVSVTASDNSSHLQLELLLSGALSQTQRLSVATQPGQVSTNQFVVSLAGAQRNGGALSVILRALDDAGNVATAFRTLIVPDSQPPRLITFAPTNGAARQSLWVAPLTFTFDEPLGGTSISTNTVRFLNSAGFDWPYRVVPSGNQIRVEPILQPLWPGITYTNLLLPALSDASGNPWIDPLSQTPPSSGAAFSFSTAAILELSPAPDTRIIAGQAVTVSVNFELGLGATSFGFRVDTNPPVIVNVNASSTNATAVLTIPSTAVAGSIRIEAQRSGLPSYVLPELRLDVRPYGADDDGDGMPNGYEVANQLNPYVNDADLDPDLDRLSNLQEFRTGTDPHLADTDADGLTDGQEVASGGCLNSLKADSDGDGLPDGVDPYPCAVGLGLVFQVPSHVTVLEGVTTNLPLRVVSDQSSVKAIDFAPTGLPPLFASLGSFGFAGTSTNGIASATLALAPTFDAAGDYILTLRSVAVNGAVTTTNITVQVLDNPSLVVSRWLGGTNGNWSTASRWSQGLPDTSKIAVVDAPGTYQVTIDVDAPLAGLVVGGVPGAQTILHSSRVLTLNGPSEVRSNGVLRFGNGAIQGSGRFAIGGQMDWLAGSLGGSGRVHISAAGQLNATGAGSKTLARELQNDGTLNLNGGLLSFANSRVSNEGRGRVLAQGVILQNGGITCSFTNYGTFAVVGTNAVTLTGVPFYNFGTVVLTNGTLGLNGGGLHTTALDVGAGATLTLGGVFTTTESSAIGGAGRIQFNSGTHTFQGDFLPTRPMAFTSGLITFNRPLPITVMTNNGATLTFNSPQSLDLLTFQSGILSGSGDLSLNGQTYWTSGSMTGSGRVIVSSNALVQASGPGTKVVGRILENRGTIALNGPVTLSLVNGIVVNRSWATILAQNVVVQNSGVTNSFLNEGLFVVVGTNAVSISVPLENLGSVVTTNGSLTFNAAVTNRGSLSIGNGVTNIFGNVVELGPSSRFLGTGILRFRQPCYLTGPVNFGAMTAIFETGATINGSFPLSNEVGGQIVFEQSIAVPASVRIGGSLRVGASSTAVTLDGTLTLEAGATLANPGSLRVFAFVNKGGVIIGNAPVLVAPPIVRILEIQAECLPVIVPPSPQTITMNCGLILKWQATPGWKFAVETSADLSTWGSSSAVVSETAPGIFQATLSSFEPTAFVRLRKR